MIGFRFCGWVLAVITVIIVPGCVTLNLESRVQSSIVTVDGDASEWQGDEFPIADHPVTTMQTNDSENLYILMVFNDPELQQRILETGWEFNLASPQNKNVFVRMQFPITHLAGGQSPDQPDQDISEWKLTLTGMEKPQMLRCGQSNAFGVDLMLTRRENRIVGEMRIPLRYCTGRDRSDIDLRRPVSWEMHCAGSIRLDTSGAPGMDRGSDFGGMGSGVSDGGRPDERMGEGGMRGDGFGGDSFGGGGAGRGGGRSAGKGPGRNGRSPRAEREAIDIKGKIVLSQNF